MVLQLLLHLLVRLHGFAIIVTPPGSFAWFYNYCYTSWFVSMVLQLLLHRLVRLYGVAIIVTPPGSFAGFVIIVAPPNSFVWFCNYCYTSWFVCLVLQLLSYLRSFAWTRDNEVKTSQIVGFTP